MLVVSFVLVLVLVSFTLSTAASLRNKKGVEHVVTAAHRAHIQRATAALRTQIMSEFDVGSVQMGKPFERFPKNLKVVPNGHRDMDAEKQFAKLPLSFF